MKAPTPDQMRVAADWLESYEPGPDDTLGADMNYVAAWLRERADALALSETIRRVAKSSGKPIALVRKAAEKWNLGRREKL